MKLTKKLTALILALCCLMPMTAFAEKVDLPFTPGKDGTFFTWVWEYTSDMDNLYMPFQLRNVASNNAARGNYKDGAIAVARKMKAYFDTGPDGKRAVNPYHSLSEGTRAETNCFWYDGIPKYEALMDEIIYYYKRLGGKEINAVVSDHESRCNVWYQEGNAKNKGLTMDEYYALAEQDPRYPELRQSLIDYGIRMYEGDDHPELYYLYANANTGTINTEVKRDVYLGIMWADRWFEEQCMEKVYQVWKKHYPDITFSDYGTTVSNDPTITGGGQGHRYGMFSEPEPMEERKVVGGTHVSPVLYGRIDANGETLGKHPDYPYEKYYTTPYNAVLLYIIELQNNVLYLPDVKIRPWVGSYTWSYNNRGPWAATDYWKEFVYHLGLMGSDPMLYYNAEAGDQGIDDNVVMSELLHDLDEVAGFEDKKTLVKDYTPWDSRYILTGMSAGGKNVWRITPDLSTDDVTIETFKVSDNPLKFQIGQQIVEFPEGSYVYEPKGARQFPYSKAGYWVISPEGTEPEETLDTDETPAKEPEYAFGGAEELKERVAQIKAQNGEIVVTDEVIDKAKSIAEEFKSKFKSSYKSVFSSIK